MLTSDLLVARVRRGKVQPGYLPTEGPAGEAYRIRAANLIELFQAHLERSRGELNDALDDLVRGRPDFRVDRGFAKLLRDRCSFYGLEPEVAADLRLAVFARAAEARAAGGFERGAVLAAVLEEPGPAALGLRENAGPRQLEDALYGDLKRNQILESFDPPSPAALIQRYNLALAQAVLLRAHSLRVEVREPRPPRMRQLLRQVRFQGLLQTARREADGRVVLELDGPLSIFTATPRYGVKMAGFLPSLLLCEEWRLEATVAIGRSRTIRDFELGPEAGLVTHARDVGAWLPTMIEAFAPRFDEVGAAKGWRVSEEVELLHLGDEVIVPDFAFEHEGGYRAAMEVLGYWRRGGVERRLEVLRQHETPNLLLALDHSLKLGKDKVKDLEGVVPFREVPNARTVLRLLEKLRKEHD